MSVAPPLSPMATLRWSVVRDFLSSAAPARVLEVGCGQGGFGARIAAMADYIGVEPDAASCAVAQERIEPIGGTVLQGTSDLIGTDEQFDLICAFEVIEHLEDDVAAIKDWAQRLKPGGAMLVSVPAWQRRYGPMDRLVGHYRRYEPESLEATLTGAGLERPRHSLYGWPLGFALEAVRNRIAERRRAMTEDSMASRSATSGRLLQPKAMAGAMVRLGVTPFVPLQRVRPQAGTGLVAIAYKPASTARPASTT